MGIEEGIRHEPDRGMELLVRRCRQRNNRAFFKAMNA